MAMSDPLGDMLTRIRNGQSAGKTVVSSPASRFRSTATRTGARARDALARRAAVSLLDLRFGRAPPTAQLAPRGVLPLLATLACRRSCSARLTS